MTPRTSIRTRWRRVASAILLIAAGLAHETPARAALCGYVANEGDGTVSVVDLTTRQVVHTAIVGDRPTSVAISRTGADGALALVVDRADAALSVLSLERGMALPVLPLTADPAAVAVRANGTVYIVHPNTGTLTTLDVDQGEGATALSLTGRPVAVAVAEAPPLVLVANEADNQLLVVDDAAPPLVSPYRVGTTPTAVAVDAKSGLAYVSAMPLTVIDPVTGEVKGTVSIPAGGTPSAITVTSNPAAALLCVKGAAGGSLLVVPTDLNLPRSTLQLGAAVDPSGVAALASVDNMAFVTDRAGDQLLFVDLTAGVVGNVALGRQPSALAVAELDDSVCWGPVAQPTATPTSGGCVGDCDSDGTVAINELIVGVNIALGSAPATQCPAFDTNGDGEVVISELISAVGAALNGCS